tara:strand:+ start:228 stop:1682 length:1455 start_codon:yes stop_codon:yes gene_type:complete
MNKINWNFNNSYSKLSNYFRENINPIPVKNPNIIIFNNILASELDLDFSKVTDKELSEIFSGNSLPSGSNSIAQAYAGHQFGHFTMLGDGRAILLGEHVTKKNKKYDVQFKGSGKTSFSRNGDGRAALGPMLREYIVSEAMNSMNIPSTRSLAVVKTGENIIREEILQGAILTRVASSHIRVGTFQYISARQKFDELNILFNYTIERHFPEIKQSKNQALDFLDLLIDKHCDLVVNWMRVGFIHGVMNTDNMTISGETIDYGPCAFMDTYDPKTVFSSIDKMGRYAYCNQPIITKWNLARLAECLIPLIDKNQNKAIEMATEKINSFEKRYEEKWLNMMKKKLGLSGGTEKTDKFLILDLLTWMHQNKADYTNTFCYLMDNELVDNKDYENKSFNNWKKQWMKRLSTNNSSQEKTKKLMRDNNPLIIPRNQKVEEVLKAADENDFKPLKNFIEMLTKPYTKQNNISEYQLTSNSNIKYKTFCGT